MAQSFKETAHLKTDSKKYKENYDKIFNKNKLSDYQDKWSRWHDKKTGSNNGWIYTAYAKRLGKNIKEELLTECFNLCLRSKENFIIDRWPGVPEPPISKDEIIGLASLGLIDSDLVKHLKNNHWNFFNGIYYDKSNRNIFKAIKTLWKIRNEHRNFVWQNKLYDGFMLAFNLDWGDRHYLLKVNEIKSKPHYFLWFLFGVIFSFFNGSRSSQMIMWLQMSDLYPKLSLFLPKKKYLKNYFENGHPFRK